MGCYELLRTGKNKALPCFDKPCKFSASEMMLSEFSPWLELYQMMGSEIVSRAGLGPLHYKRFKVKDEEISLLGQIGAAVSEAFRTKAAEKRAMSK